MFLLTILGVLAAFGPFVTDMYLPALPSMGIFFNTNAALVQLGLTGSLLGLAFGQLIVGPLSDKYGRRVPLLFSLWLFVVSTIACIFSPTIGLFIFFRVIQGIAGAGGIVLSRSIATDYFTGKELAKAFAMISAVNGLAPICAPVAGGVLLKFTGWQGIFVVLLLLGFLLIVLCSRLKESLPDEKRNPASVWSTFATFLPLLRKKRFMLYVLLQAFVMGVVFAYISSSPFILQNHYHLSPLAYSLCFAGNAIALIIGTSVAASFRSVQNGVRLGLVGMAVLSVGVASTLILDGSLWIFEVVLFLMLIFGGLLLPATTVLALENEREMAGTASAILGAMTFVAGGIVSPLVGVGNTLHATAWILVVCSFCALGLMLVSEVLRNKRKR